MTPCPSSARLAKVRQLGQQSRPSPGTAALDRALGDAQHLGGLRDRVVEHVDQHQRDLLVVRQLAQRRGHLDRHFTAGGRVGAQVVWAIESRTRSSLPLTSGRALRRRILSRQALTTIRCSQVVTADSPLKLSARLNAEIMASWSASAASSGRQRPDRDRPQPVLVPQEQLAERIGISGHVSLQQLGVRHVGASPPRPTGPSRRALHQEPSAARARRCQTLCRQAPAIP